MTNIIVSVFLLTNSVSDIRLGWHMRHAKDTNAVVPVGPRTLVEATIVSEVKTLVFTFQGERWTVSRTNLVSYEAVHSELRPVVSGTNSYLPADKFPFQLRGAELIPLPK